MVSLNRVGFQAIPLILTDNDLRIMVVVEDRRPLCWSCKQLCHLSRACPQKKTNNSNNNINNNNINNTSSPEKKHTSPTINPALEPGNHLSKPEEEWTQVIRKGKKKTQFARSNTKDVWHLIEKANRANIRLAEIEHLSFKKVLSYCSGWVPIYVHPFFIEH